MKKIFNMKTLLKMVLSGGGAVVVSELLTTLLSATNILSPEVLQNNGFLQSIFSASKSLLGGSVSLQPVIQWVIGIVAGISPVAGSVLKMLNVKK